MTKLNVVVLCDGISMSRQVLKNLNIPCDYYSYEICPNAIQCSKNNHSDIVYLGDILSYNRLDLPDHIDLLISSNPCTSFSVAGKLNGFEADSGKLLFKAVDILRDLNPAKFLFENVKMKKDHQKVFDELIGVSPVALNSKNFGYQNRQRLYWSNCDLTSLKNANNGAVYEAPLGMLVGSRTGKGFRPIKTASVPTLTTVPACFCFGVNSGDRPVQYATAEQWEHVAGLPSGYTRGFAERRRKSMIGLGFDLKTLESVLKLLTNYQTEYE